MNVEVIVRIGGREVVTLNHRFSGDSLEIEPLTECHKDRIGQVILTEAYSRFDATLRRPCCCGRPHTQEKNADGHADKSKRENRIRTHAISMSRMPLLPDTCGSARRRIRTLFESRMR